MSKYKYYFRKPRSAIVKDILDLLITAGVIMIAASSPYFTIHLWRRHKWLKRYGRKKVYDTFYLLRRRGYIDFEKRGKQIYISLTDKGKEKAGWMQIDALKIKKPKKWDGKWRLVMFDIQELKKIYREAFRGRLKELGFVPLQKSVWVHPFECRDEIEVLRAFFGLSEKELRLVVTSDLGDDYALRQIFKL